MVNPVDLHMHASSGFRHFLDRVSCGPYSCREGRTQNPAVSDVISEYQHKPGVDRVAFGFVSSFVHCQELSVKSVWINDVWVGPELSH